MPTIDDNWVPDSAGNSFSEICSHQDQIVYLYGRLSGCNSQHHDHKAWWDLNTVSALKTRFRLCYLPTSQFWLPPPIIRHWAPATRLWSPATRLPVPGACNTASLWIGYGEACMGVYSQVRLGVSCIWRVYLGVCSGVCLRASWELAWVRTVKQAVRVPSSAIGSVREKHAWECTWERAQRCAWERTWSVFGSVWRADFGAYSQADCHCVIECDWECIWERVRDYAWVCHQVQMGASGRLCNGVYLITYSEVYLGAYLDCTWECLESVSQAGWECAIVCNQECTSERTWEHAI